MYAPRSPETSVILISDKSLDFYVIARVARNFSALFRKIIRAPLMAELLILVSEALSTKSLM